MAIVFKDLDEIPAFTGEEDVKEQIQKLYNYIYALKDQIRYLLQNLGIENMNPSAWAKMKSETLDGQTQEDAFNKLTNNGKVQGFGVEDGRLYINAEFVKVLNLIAEKLRTSSGGFTILVQDGLITSVHDDETDVNLVEIKSGHVDFEGDVSGYVGYFGTIKVRSLLKRPNGGRVLNEARLSPEGIIFCDESGQGGLSIPSSAKWEYVDSLGIKVLVDTSVEV